MTTLLRPTLIARAKYEGFLIFDSKAKLRHALSLKTTTSTTGTTSTDCKESKQ
jgi:hypothetical protein